MSETIIATSMDYNLVEFAETIELHDDPLRPVIGILTGVVLSIPLWALIGWFVFSLRT